MSYEMINKIALVIGYSIIFSLSFIFLIVVAIYTWSCIEFRKYRKKSMKDIMDYANEKPPQLLMGKSLNTIEKPNIFIDGIYSEICKN